MWANSSTDQKKFTDHMFNIKLEEKSYKMSLKLYWLKQSGQKTTLCPTPGADRDEKALLNRTLLLSLLGEKLAMIQTFYKKTTTTTTTKKPRYALIVI